MQKELLSAYIDGEQVSNEFTAELCQNGKLQQSWASYHLIRSVMREESNVILGSDFTAQMEHLIEQEDTVISQPTPEQVEQRPFMPKWKSWFAPIVQVAVAASVCLVAVMGFQSFNNHSKQNMADTPVLQTLPFNTNIQEVSYNAPMKDAITPEQVEQKNKRIGALLQNYELQRRIYTESAQNQHK